ncbi:methyltransferase domain-containing protein [Primorskyibacter aestuariivivens]|uniref:methyltransferase domain-containing protein n=1 Tax=Primorskyibacter aestuariivivens TaxID=1888912 RepID=UPI0023006894|nr:methyltransferase domain-containing protein [Primorskyibacter aestuariivivens]MDA7427607.1 methyltransferase domain-containing protein [Primorskyibacter aestuariivivens]
MGHEYSTRFFDYIETGARASAQRFIRELQSQLPISSVLDVGCGRGAWLDEWQVAGVAGIAGVDGAYVDTDTLRIPAEAFHAADLTGPVDLGRRFDLVQCLEVGEHLPPGAAPRLVDNLTAHGDCVLFSAAQPGQGGEFHVNEQPLEHWRALFKTKGYAAHDFLRPRVANDRSVEPWYRYNAVLYLNEAGIARASEDIRASRVADMTPLPACGDLRWRLRRRLVRLLPVPAVTWLAQTNAKLKTRQAHDAKD